MYADDSTMYSAGSTLRELNNTLNIELKPVADWVTENRLVLNIAETKCMVLGSRHMLNWTKHIRKMGSSKEMGSTYSEIP